MCTTRGHGRATYGPCWPLSTHGCCGKMLPIPQRQTRTISLPYSIAATHLCELFSPRNLVPCQTSFFLVLSETLGKNIFLILDYFHSGIGRVKNFLLQHNPHLYCIDLDLNRGMGPCKNTPRPILYVTDVFFAT